MENAITYEQLGTIGLLLSALGGLWAWHVKTVAKKDDQLKKQAESNEKLLIRSMDVIDKNTSAYVQHANAIQESIESQKELHRSLTDYVIQAAGKK